ncbi:MAG: glycoside hydrolase family 3 protein [Clostridia bacterium]|nr:glycoside hydrolase family 3 protein [Clostridia bacterium]
MENRYVINWEKYADAARRAAAEGAVLLRNEGGALPFRENARISVFGRIQFHYYKSGTGSGGLVNTRYTVGILDALKEEKSLRVNEALEAVYRDWLREHPHDPGKGWGGEPWSQEEMPLSDDTVQAAARESDAALVIIGRTAGEDQDAANEPGSYLLTETERDMLRKVRSAFDRMTVVLNVGGIMDMRWVEEYRPDAVMYVWQGGMEGGHAVADLLTGRVTPCGKLTDTIARDISDYPSTGNFGGAVENVYQEDVYVGYRWFETFAPEKVLYPFGFGLSYTAFSLSCRDMAVKDGRICLTVRVTNTGRAAGKEVAQVYACPPQGKLGKPRRSLIAFAKTALLAPGQTEELAFDIPCEKLASYDDSGAAGHKSCYVLEAGDYGVYVGTDARSAERAGGFAVPETRAVQTLREALSPVAAFDRVRPVPGEGDRLIPGFEAAPTRTYDLDRRIRDEAPGEIAYTGDRGIQLADVLDGRQPMDAFLAQLTNDDLCCMVRGEGMCSPKVTPGTAAAFGGVTERLKAFGIPCGCCSDGPSGIRMDCGTYAFSLPNGTCLACTFNEALNEELFSFLGAELRKNRVDTILGPGINIHRNPLNGRNFEYFSEDPLVTGKIAAAQLRGMHSYGVTGTIKHFAANNQEFHRREINSVASERALREIYLKGFEIAVREAGAYSVMTTYGALNGIWTAGNYDLDTGILRNEWGFEGVVMSDWWAAMNDEGQKPSLQNTAAMVRAQNDLYMVVSNAQENSARDNLRERLAEGALTRGQLQRSARNILRVLMRSPAMARMLNRLSPEELAAAEQLDADDQVNFDLKYLPIREELTLDAEGLDTEKGASHVYGIQIETPGFYDLHMRLHVEAAPLAQVPVTVFANGKNMGTLSFTGENRQSRDITVDLSVFAGAYNFVRLYFAQSGIRMEKLSVTLREKLTRSFWE